MKKIPAEEVTFHPHSFVDPAGRLFFWRGNLYRGINKPYVPLVHALLSEPIIQRAMSDGLLVETEPVALEIANYAMVLRHRNIPFPSYAEEWCPAMLKDGALAVLNLALRLVDGGLTLKDGHSWNLVFDGARPVFVDFTSIVPSKGTVFWRGYDEFTRFFLNPLRIMLDGQDRVARYLLSSTQGALPSEVAAFTSMSKSNALLTLHRVIKASIAPVRSLIPWQLRHKELSLFSLQSHLTLAWREIEKISLPPIPNRPGALVEPSDSVRNSLRAIIDQLRPRSVGMIENTLRVPAQATEDIIVPTVSLHTNVDVVTYNYQNTRGTAIRHLPLVMDFTTPTPSRGTDEYVTVAAPKRLSAELVVGPDLLPDVVAQKELSMVHLVRGMAEFTARFLVMNLIKNSEESGDSTKILYFAKILPVLKQQFRRVDVVEQEDSERAIVVCER
jgi:hypothetical protein